MNGAVVDCQWGYVDLLESRCAGPNVQRGVVCANVETDLGFLRRD